MSAGDIKCVFRYQETSHFFIAMMEFIVVVIKMVMMGDVDIGLKIPSTLPLSIMEK